jgi:hypothetical protein
MKLSVFSSSAFKLSAFIDNLGVIEHLVSNKACSETRFTGVYSVSWETLLNYLIFNNVPEENNMTVETRVSIATV